MSRKTIQIRIKPDGQTQVLDVTGVGSGCTDLTKSLEQRLGTEVPGSRSSTSSLYDVEEENSLSASTS